MGVEATRAQRILRHGSLATTTGTYVDVIETVQRNALDGMNVFLDEDDDASSA